MLKISALAVDLGFEDDFLASWMISRSGGTQFSSTAFESVVVYVH